MKILHALSQTELTGSEAYAHRLVQHQVKQRGWDVQVWSDQLHLPFVCASEPIAFHHRKRELSFLWELTQRLRREKFDLIHAHSRGALRSLYWPARWAGIPIISTIHGRQHDSWSKRLFKEYGEKIIVIAENIREQFVTEWGYSAEQVQCIPNPVDPPEPRRAPPQGAPPRFLIAGRSTGPKGAGLRQFFKDNCMHLRWPAGAEVVFLQNHLPEPLVQELRQQAQLAGLQLQLITKAVPLDEYIHSATHVVGSGRIAIEALQAGKPVYALGEAGSLGWVTAQNWEECLASNFADICKFPGQRFTVEPAQGEFATGARFCDEQVFAWARSHFAGLAVCEKICSLTEQVARKYHCPHLPILMYHKVLPQPVETVHQIYVTEATFRWHLRTLRFLGFTTLSAEELSHCLDHPRDFPKKPVLITFDDGYRSVLSSAAPVLQRYGMRAILYLLADTEKKLNDWDPLEPGNDPDLMSSQERRTWIQLGFSVGSHGLTHQRLTELSPEQTLTELVSSKKLLEAELGVACLSFCYPFGERPAQASQLSQDAGYRFAVNTNQGPFDWTEDIYSLFRIHIFPQDGVVSLCKKLSHWYRKRYFRKHRST